jgi:hypothetical protein
MSVWRYATYQTARLLSNLNPILMTESAFNLDFAEPELSLRRPTETAAQDFVTQGLAQLRRVKDEMAGKTVIISGQHHYSGYRGVIQSTHVHLNQYAVRLEATGSMMMIDGTFLTIIS